MAQLKNGKRIWEDYSNKSPTSKATLKVDGNMSIKMTTR